MAETILTEKVRHPSVTNSWLTTKDIQVLSTAAGDGREGTQIRQYDGTNLLNVGNDYSEQYSIVATGEMTTTVGDTLNPKEEGWYINNGSTTTPNYVITTDVLPYTSTYQLIVTPTGNPHDQGWYEEDEEAESGYTQTEDTLIEDETKDYYERIDTYKTDYYYKKEQTLPKPVYVNQGLFVPAAHFGAASTLSLPISIKDGGTGATNITDAKINLDIPSLETVSSLTTSVSELAASISSLTVTEGTIWDVPISILNGGTSATDAETARANLGLGLISTMNGAPGGYNDYTNELWHECYIYSGTTVMNVNADRYDRTIWDPQTFVTNFHLNPFKVHTDGSYTEDLDSYTIVQETWNDYGTLRTISRRSYTYVDDGYNMGCLGVAFSEGDGANGVIYKAVTTTYGLGPLCAEYWGIQTAYPGWHARWQHKTGNTALRRFNYIVVVPRALHMDNPPTHLRKIGLKNDGLVDSSTNVTGRFWGENDRY